MIGFGAVRSLTVGFAMLAMLACGTRHDESKAAFLADAPSCDDCRAKSCNADENQEHFDLPRGCLVAPEPRFVPSPNARFTADCKAALECAYEHDCAYDAAQGVVHCYCGSRRVGECLDKGPADDAACVKEWQAATRSTDNIEIMHRFSKVEYPSGWAYHLLECDRDRCGAQSELGRCVP